MKLKNSKTRKKLKINQDQNKRVRVAKVKEKIVF